MRAKSCAHRALANKNPKHSFPLPSGDFRPRRFHGHEVDTSSCLAFAPKSKHGHNGQATEADWQAGREGPDSEGLGFLLRNFI